MEPTTATAISDNHTTANPSAPETMASIESRSGAQILGADFANGDLPIGVRAFIESGVHFGHQTKRWNPKMRPYIYGSRNGIHIVDLDQTAQLFRRAYRFVVEAVGRGGQLLFVGTKSQAAEIVQEHAERAQQFYVTGRWLGGTLTNFRTVKASIDRLRDLEQRDADGSLDSLLKREALGLRREKDKLYKYLGGIKDMSHLPAALFVVDPNHEHIAVREGRKLNIPIIALTDTNCDPDQVDYVVPGNDDAIRSVRLIATRIADACIEGKQRHRSQSQGSYDASEQHQGGVQVDFSRGRRQRGAGGARNGAAEVIVESTADTLGVTTSVVEG